MTALTRSVRGSANQLLYHVLEEPQLLAAVRELPAPVLVRLIDHVGLEDAGELIALTSTKQLGQVFDAELWQSAEPGADETFRPERFALFLRLLYEAGESFVVERLLALPRELLTLAVHKLLLVIDIDALTVRFGSVGRYGDDSIDRAVRAIENAQFEEWEEFRLIARDPNAFEDLWNALLVLDREDHELVRYVIERCCDMDGELIEESGLYDVLNDEEMLESDIASERSERRGAAGFVAPADARAFLELARREAIDEAPDGRDPISRAYFRELSPEQPTSTGSARALPATGARAGFGAQADLGRLLAVLRDANVLDDEPSANSSIRRLTADKMRSAASENAERDTKAVPSAKGKAVGGAAQRRRRGEQEQEQAPAKGKAAAKVKRAKGDAAARTAKRAGVPEHAAIVQQPVESSDAADENGSKSLTLMAAAMLVLRESHAALHAQRTEELGFLANVLVAGSQHDGRKFRPVEAIECALAICSVGLERRALEPQQRRGAAATAEKAAELLTELSADRLFRAGLYALRTELGERARADVAQLLGIKRTEVAAAMSGGTTSLISQLGIEADAAVALAALAEPEPWLAGRLACRDHLFIASQNDIQLTLSFLTAHAQDSSP